MKKDTLSLSPLLADTGEGGIKVTKRGLQSLRYAGAKLRSHDTMLIALV